MIEQIFNGKKSMTYTLNPHRHVKIWLSDDKNVFMNLTNQKRLIKMRHINPKDEIHLVYDSRLLTPTACENLQKFCTKYRITPKDFSVVKAQDDTEEILIHLYEDEILNLNDGGNLGAASDIIRWIPEVFKLGIYSDLDVGVDTRHLPDTVEVERPVLLDLGSVRLSNKEQLLVNNHIVAVANEAMDCAEINNIQQNIIKGLTNKDIFKQQIERIKAHKDDGDLTQRVITSTTNSLNQLHTDYENKSIREFRQHLRSVYVNQTLFCKKKDLSVSQIAAITRALGSSLLIKWLLPAIYQKNASLAKNKSDYELVTELMELEATPIFVNSVIYTSGPVAVERGLFSSTYYSPDKINSSVAPYSLEHHNLSKAFITNNRFDLHTSCSTVMKKIKSAGDFVGTLCDISWLKIGKDALSKRDQKAQAKKEVYNQTLPANFIEMKTKVSDHIAKIEADLLGCFGFYRNKQRHVKIAGLKDILTCFEQDKFNISKFETILESFKLYENNLYASIGKSVTKELIDDLIRFSNKATLYEVDSCVVPRF